ncbi:hypothetical protein [Methanoregula formicica]|uniref:Uncharacterized protein n=1 Tax=Methanoregula formicica (strain DSM 22288 / NBRC 105244 / SMSP) TaxID=593750 RepID=L0HJD3_METFS|nr:hypothetical protein [Methanoregula formicica]AGB03901.1 hypothetical protein Metfor_2921 [Methanoregula formicica SMSP]
MEPEILTRGIFALIVGVLCFLIPTGMQAVFAYLVGIFLLVLSIVTGAISISESGKVHWGVLVIAYSLEALPFRILLGVSGFFALLFGIIIGFAPLPTEGSVILILLIGVFCLFFSIISLITGMLMHKGEVIVAA